MTMIKKAKHLILRAINRVYWPKLLSDYRACILSGHIPSDDLLNSLVYHWGNAGWSSDCSYLKRLLLEIMQRENLVILECGSGLTTLLLGIVADRQQHRIIACEHLHDWQHRMADILTKEGIKNAEVLWCPLIDYGVFDWYDTTKINLMPNTLVDLVICDGPPGQTRGGRSGLPYLLSTQFRDRCLILVDDTHRTSDKEILHQWMIDFNLLPDEQRSDDAHFKVLIFRRVT